MFRRAARDGVQDRPLDRQSGQRESQRYSQLRASVDDLYQDFEEVV